MKDQEKKSASIDLESQQNSKNYDCLSLEIQEENITNNLNSYQIQFQLGKSSVKNKSEIPTNGAKQQQFELTKCVNQQSNQFQSTYLKDNKAQGNTVNINIQDPQPISDKFIVDIDAVKQSNYWQFQQAQESKQLQKQNGLTFQDLIQDISNEVNAIKQKQNFISPKNNDDTQKSTVGTKQLQKSSTLFDDEYFFDEREQTSVKKSRYLNPEQFHKLRDHQVEWDLKVFFEFLIYHFLFYYITGPFTIILFFKKEKLMRNLSFWGNKFQFYVQSVLYFLNAFNLILYFTSDNTNIYTVEIVYMEVVLFLRAYIISCKYATLHPDKLQLYKNYELEGELTLQDYYFARWVFQSDITIYRESYNAFQRAEFDSSMFYLNFIVNPSQECINQIDDGIQCLKIWHKHDHEYITPCIFPSENYVYGYGVVHYLIKSFIKDNPNAPLLAMAIILALFRGFLLLIYRYLDKEVSSTNFSTIEIVQMVGIVYNTSFGYFSSFVFLIFFTKDLKLKNYLQKQCIQLISAKKLNLGVKKLLPTINFTDPYSIKTWSTLRRLFLDYGKAYYLRLEAFISIYVFVAIFSLAALMLWLFNVYALPQNIGVACGFEAFMILFFLFYLLIQGAIINTNFDMNKNIIFDYQMAYDDVIRLRKFYFHNSQESSNMVRQKIISSVQKKFKIKEDTDKQSDEKIFDYLNEIKESFNDCYKEVNQDSITQPFVFFGIQITTVLVQNVLVALGTSAVGVVQYYLHSKNN
ncbi:hypothetical protein ABPG72_006140 [Tetrahymena utriculariae]